MKKIIYKSRMRKWYYFVLFLIQLHLLNIIYYVLSIMIYYNKCKWISKQRQHIVFRNLQFMDVPTVLRHFLYNIYVSFTIRLSSSKHFQRNDQKIHWNCCYLSLKNLYSVFKNLLLFSSSSSTYKTWYIFVLSFYFYMMNLLKLQFCYNDLFVLSTIWRIGILKMLISFVGQNYIDCWRFENVALSNSYKYKIIILECLKILYLFIYS